MLIVTENGAKVFNTENIKNLVLEDDGSNWYLRCRYISDEKSEIIALFKNEETAKSMLDKIISQYEKGHKVFRITGKGVL